MMMMKVLFKNAIMKNLLCILSVVIAFTSCKSADPYKEADLINQEIEHRLDSLYNSENESVILYRGLKEIKDYHNEVVKQKKILFEVEKRKIFNDEIFNIEELEIFKKIKKKIQQDQRGKYVKIVEGVYCKDNKDVYSVFTLQKNVNLEKKGVFTFYNRNGSLYYEIRNDLLYFEGNDNPIFIKQVSNKSFSLISEDLIETTFIEDENLIICGNFSPSNENDDNHKFTILIKDKVVIENKDYPAQFQHQKVYMDGEYFDEYWISLVSSPYPGQFTLLKNREGHFDYLTYGYLEDKKVWERNFKELPKNIIEFMKSE